MNNLEFRFFQVLPKYFKLFVSQFYTSQDAGKLTGARKNYHNYQKLETITKEDIPFWLLFRYQRLQK